MKKTLGVGIALVAAVALSSCKMHTEVTIESDGTGSYAVEQAWPKALFAESMGVTEDEVVGAFEQDLISEGTPPGAEFSVSDAGENVEIYTSVPFTYDADGWAFSQADATPEEASLIMHDSGQAATFTYSLGDTELTDTTSELDDDLGGSDNMFFEAMDLQVVVTFPGEVGEVTGGGTIDGTTVTWSSENLTAAMNSGQTVSATGSLAGGAAPPPGSGTESEGEEEPPAAQPEEPADTENEGVEDDEREDRRADEDDEVVTTDDDGFPWLWVIIPLIILLVLVGAGVAIFLATRKKSPPNQDPMQAQYQGGAPAAYPGTAPGAYPEAQQAGQPQAQPGGYPQAPQQGGYENPQQGGYASPPQPADPNAPQADYPDAPPPPHPQQPPNPQ